MTRAERRRPAPTARAIAAALRALRPLAGTTAPRPDLRLAAPASALPPRLGRPPSRLRPIAPPAPAWRVLGPFRVKGTP